jgi:uncharacterized protein (TIGR02646 family)
VKSIRRPNVQLPTLLPAGTGGAEATRRENLFNTSHNLGDVNTEFSTYWGSADVRGALWAMCGRSCAYCDRELPGNDRGDVEHFRPKSIYWWLAYKFENYLLACSVCNSAYKGEKFPLLSRSTAFDYFKKDRIATERRALIDPVADVTDGWFGIDFTADFKRKGFPITINSGIGRLDTKRCRTTMDFFRLNKDSELKKARLIAVHYALNLIEKAEKGDTASAKELREKAVRFSSHSFAVRQAILLKGKPEYLPSLEEEVEWLLEDLITILNFALEAVADDPNSTTEKDRRDRCAWALAVLMKDPPALATTLIRERLVAENLLEIVQPLYNRL